MAERDYIATTKERVVVFDGGMGATLEQFEMMPAEDRPAHVPFLCTNVGGAKSARMILEAVEAEEFEPGEQRCSAEIDNRFTAGFDLSDPVADVIADVDGELCSRAIAQ